MAKICGLCWAPAGVAPLHKKCAELYRDRYRDCWNLLRAGIRLWRGAIRNAARDEKRWKAYLEWENARLMLLGKDADSHVPRSRLKGSGMYVARHPSMREEKLEIQEVLCRQIELGPYLGEEPYLGGEEPC